MTDEQIKHMVDRFLAWKLPENFSPDGGISFKATFNEHTDHPMKHEPSGTNLFDATQANAMIRYVVEDCDHDVWDILLAALIDHDENKMSENFYREPQWVTDARKAIAERPM